KVEDDFKTRAKVDAYFLETLPGPQRLGKFFLPRTAIGADGISPGEKLIFTYKGECVYQARADSTRKKNIRGNRKYPYYFLVNLTSIKPIQGTLSELQQKLTRAGLDAPNLVKSRKWLRFDDNEPAAQFIDEFVSQGADTTPDDPTYFAKVCWN